MCSDTTRNSNTRCSYPGCNKRVWQDPDGSYSSHCSNGHRRAMAQAANGNGSLCKQCNVKPCYVENGHGHPFCGQRCAAAAKAGTPPSRAPSIASTSDRCRFAGCNKQVFVNRNGTPSEFCSNAHRLQAVQGGGVEACLFCSRYPKTKEGDRDLDFCSRKCKDDAMSSAPIILEVPRTDKKFNDVSSQFTSKWAHTTAVPQVVKIYKIFCEPHLMDKFGRYRLKIQRKSQTNDPNERRRFHGTARACTLGDNDNKLTTCDQQTCSLCQIIKSSFQLAAFGRHTNFGRFGAGIYTSATSSKANDYVRELGGSQYRSMLLNKVIMGKSTSLYVDNPSLKEPPAGYDSVTGEPGGSLNYDESIVYTNDAIRPAYLIIYQ